MPCRTWDMMDTHGSSAVVGSQGRSLPPLSSRVDRDVTFDGKREEARLAAKADPVGSPHHSAALLSIGEPAISDSMALCSWPQAVEGPSSEKDLVLRYRWML